MLSKVSLKCLHGRIPSLFSFSRFNYEILVPACLPLNQTFAAQETNFLFQQLDFLRSWTIGLVTPTSYADSAEVTE